MLAPQALIKQRDIVQYKALRPAGAFICRWGGDCRLAIAYQKRSEFCVSIKPLLLTPQLCPCFFSHSLRGHTHTEAQLVKVRRERKRVTGSGAVKLENIRGNETDWWFLWLSKDVVELQAGQRQQIAFSPRTTPHSHTLCSSASL